MYLISLEPKTYRYNKDFLKQKQINFLAAGSVTRKYDRNSVSWINVYKLRVESVKKYRKIQIKPLRVEQVK